MRKRERNREERENEIERMLFIESFERNGSKRIIKRSLCCPRQKRTRSPELTKKNKPFLVFLSFCLLSLDFLSTWPGLTVSA